MKTRIHRPGTPKGPPPVEDIEEYAANVMDLDNAALGMVTKESTYGIVSADGACQVLLLGVGYIGVLDEEATSWVLARKVVSARTDSWLAEAGSEFLRIVIRARA